MSLASSEALGMRPLTALIRLGRSRMLRQLGRNSEAHEDLTAARNSFVEQGMPVPYERSHHDTAIPILLAGE